MEKIKDEAEFYNDLSKLLNTYKDNIDNFSIDAVNIYNKMYYEHKDYRETK